MREINDIQLKRKDAVLLFISWKAQGSNLMYLLFIYVFLDMHIWDITIKAVKQKGGATLVHMKYTRRSISQQKQGEESTIGHKLSPKPHPWCQRSKRAKKGLPPWQTAIVMLNNNFLRNKDFIGIEKSTKEVCSILLQGKKNKKEKIGTEQNIDTKEKPKPRDQPLVGLSYKFHQIRWLLLAKKLAFSLAFLSKALKRKTPSGKIKYTISLTNSRAMGVTMMEEESLLPICRSYAYGVLLP